MSVVLSTVRRVLLVPSALPLAVLGAAGAWAGTRLAGEALGAGEGYVAEVRDGSLLFAGVLLLSLAEPLELLRETRAGLLLLRAARGCGPALLGRWSGLTLASVPVVGLAVLASGGWPSQPVALLLALAVTAAAGLALGAFLDRGRLVPALWLLLVAASLRPWIVSRPALAWAGWLLPDIGHLQGARGAAHALLWSAGALLLAEWRLRRLLAR